MAWVTAIISAVCSSFLTVLSLRACGASCGRDGKKPPAGKEQLPSAERGKVHGVQSGNAAVEGKVEPDASKSSDITGYGPREPLIRSIALATWKLQVRREVAGSLAIF